MTTPPAGLPSWLVRLILDRLDLLPRDAWAGEVALFQVRCGALAHTKKEARHAPDSHGPEARDELLRPEDPFAWLSLEPSPEDKDLLVPQFFVVAVEQEAAKPRPDSCSCREVEQEKPSRAILLGPTANAIRVSF